MTNIPTVTATIGETPYAVALADSLAHSWVADEPEELHGGNSGPTPTGLLLSSLGACTAITLKMYAARKAWPLTDVQVVLHFNPDGPAAAGHTNIHRQVTLHGDLTPEQRERLLQIANACPIHKVLSGEIHIATALDS